MTKLYIHATNTHQGGGAVLLNALINALGDREVVLQIDLRMPCAFDIPVSVHLRRIRPTLQHRLLAEFWLARNVTREDVVLCFGNLPPLLSLKCKTYVFLQNRYLVDFCERGRLKFKTNLRLMIERVWLKFFAANVDQFIVQTPSMERLVKKIFNTQPNVNPYVSTDKTYTRRNLVGYVRNKKYDFIYVASSEAHKNHFNLAKAWHLLADEHIYPTLLLTLNQDDFFRFYVSTEGRKINSDMNIINVGIVSHDQVSELYSHVNALIYPSKLESLGLPLIEARQFGLDVVASELDYVRDLVDPVESFDPNSPISIARAVKRYLGYSCGPLPLIDAHEFIAGLTP